MPSVSKAQTRLSSGPRPITVPEGTFHHNAHNLTGMRFGKLEVVCEYGRNSKRQLSWLCLCDCGNSVVRVASSLESGRTTSCGCNKYAPEVKALRRLSMRRPGATMRKSFGESSRSAIVRGLDFSLTPEEFSRLTQSSCFYCGDSPAQVKRTIFEEIVLNGIDRVDNNLGYSKENTVSCCKPCNFMKREMSWSDFTKRCARITSHMGGDHSS